MTGKDNQPEKKWLVFYTRSRAEKKAYDLLIREGFNAFLPVHTVVRQWSDRKKKVTVPLFNSYIFVFEHESRISDILQTPHISWNIKYNGKPAVMRQEAIDTIKRFIETGYTIETDNSDHLRVGDKVQVMDGPLKGTSGILHEEYNETKFSVVVEVIDQVLTINIDKKYLKFISGSSEHSGSDSYWN